MQITTGLFLGLAAASWRGYLAAGPKFTPKTRAEYDAWEAEETSAALGEAIIAALGGLSLQSLGFCNPTRLPGACQFAWGYAAVSAFRWIGNF